VGYSLKAIEKFMGVYIKETGCMNTETKEKLEEEVAAYDTP